MYKTLLAIGLFTATAAAVTLHPGDATRIAAPTPPATTLRGQPATTRPRIEVVFALDTTGSMGGLIDAARERIWSIAASMAQARPAPEIRMG